MALIQPHINKKTLRPYTTAQYAEFILNVYEKAQEDHKKNPNQQFKSPIGGIKDREILEYCQAVMKIENPYEREVFAINSLTNKEFLVNMKIDESEIK